MGETTLLIATNNPSKVRELRELLEGLPIKVVSPAELGLKLDVAETGNTYAANAQLKAKAFAAASGLISLADDSGLEIKALRDWPGVHSARAAGPNASDAQRRALVLARLGADPTTDRAARFFCHVTVADARQILAEASGTLEGKIALAESGSGGFGFDQIFIPTGSRESLAALTEAEKNRISHRARAIAQLRPFLARLAQSSPR